MTGKKSTQEDAIIDAFMESFTEFLLVYEGNTGQAPYGLCMGPEAFMLLCFHAAKLEDTGGLGSGGLAPGETPTRTVPVLKEWNGIPIVVKFTPGVEPMIDPSKAAAIMQARNEKYADNIKAATKIEGI